MLSPKCASAWHALCKYIMCFNTLYTANSKAAWVAPDHCKCLFFTPIRYNDIVIRSTWDFCGCLFFTEHRVVLVQIVVASSKLNSSRSRLRSLEQQVGNHQSYMHLAQYSNIFKLLTEAVVVRLFTIRLKKSLHKSLGEPASAATDDKLNQSSGNCNKFTPGGPSVTTRKTKF